MNAVPVSGNIEAAEVSFVLRMFYRGIRRHETHRRFYTRGVGGNKECATILRSLARRD